MPLRGVLPRALGTLPMRIAANSGRLLVARLHTAQQTSVAETDEYRDLHKLYLTGLADMENLRRRTLEEVERASQYSISNFAKDMLTVADILEAALGSVQKESLTNASGELAGLYSGVDMTLKELVHIFKRHGIEAFDSLNTRFDPHLHSAVFEVESADPIDHPAVVQVQKKGYKIRDRVLRSSQVGISKQA